MLISKAASAAALPPDAQDVFRLAYNAALAEGDENAPTAALKAVELGWEERDGAWVKRKTLLVQKYNPYHRPPGDEHGGEFTSAVGNDVISSDGLRIIEQSKDKQADNSTIRAFMEAHGLSLDDYNAVNALYYQHNLASGGEADAKIAALWNSDSKEGRAMRLFSKWNELQVEYQLGKSSKSINFDQINRAASTWNESKHIFRAGEFFNSSQEYKAFLKDSNNGDLAFYRKGSLDKPVISTSTDYRGATSGTSNFKPTSVFTFKQMKAKGYHLLAGSRGLVGVTSGAEHEYIWLKP